MADSIVFQFPLFWYSYPAIMGKWLQDSFQHGFSHGTTGDALKGKKLVLSFTSGAPEELYHKDAAMGHEIEDFLVPLQAIARLCGMDYAGFIYTGGVSYQSRHDAEKAAEILAKAKEHTDSILPPLEETDYIGRWRRKCAGCFCY